MKKDQKNKLECIGCTSMADALLVLPKLYIDRKHAHILLNEAPLDRPIMLTATVVSWVKLDKDNQTTNNPFPHSIEVTLDFEDRKNIKTRIFGMNEKAAKEAFACKDDGFQEITFQAVVREWRSGYRVLSGLTLGLLTGKIEAQYVGVGGLISGDCILDAVTQALAQPQYLQEAIEILASNKVVSAFVKEAGISLEQLVHSIHQPTTVEEGEAALKIARASVVHEIKAEGSISSEQTIASTYNIDQHLIELVNAQPEKLSQDQRKALNEIRLQVNDRRGARILLNGDVGTGKTLVFLLAIAAIARTTGEKVCVVVPSDLVARQIFRQAQIRFPDLQPALVICGSQVPAASTKMLIGTQALFNIDLPYLEALVVDEQHKFSVEQRNILRQAHTHIIEASATPIPRSLALAIFNGWRHVCIKESPIKKKITSRIATEQERSQVVDLIRKTLDSGRKVIFLYPKVTGSGASVLAAGDRLSQKFPGKVAVLHGKMKSEEKNQQLMAFAQGEKPIIVASTAIEVGVDVPDIALMVVRGTDRFGTAQLHQLRGRLVRAGGHGDFVMMLDKKPSKQIELRLEAVCQCTDGFSLAERDMEIRGFGDILGDFQSGKKVMSLFKLPRLEVSDFTS